jgi:non-specific serine/threonine protein kinase
MLRWRDGDIAGATAAAKESLVVRRVVEDEQFTVALALESLGWIAGSEGRDQRAATLLGASDRMWQAMHMSLASCLYVQDFHDETAAAVQSRLGAEAFAAATGRGSELSPADAIAMALERKPKVQVPEPRPEAAAGAGLTKREREVAALIAQGLSNREIANRLVVAQRTAEGHVENILSKLGFTSRAQVASWLASQNHQQD